MTAVTALTATTNAAITAPTNGALIRDEGPLTITENPGAVNTGTWGALCNNAAGVGTTITVTRASDNVVVHNVAKAGTGAFTTTFDTTGADAGIYNITSTAQGKHRPGFFGNCNANNAPVVSNASFEYRPWQHSNFEDLLGHGSVSMNTTPAEFQWVIDGTASPVISNPTTNEARYFASPEGLIDFPANPLDCSGNILACLPPASIECTQPLSPNCVPRLVVLDYTKGGANPDRMFGLFDLETGAFAAFAQTGGKTRVLVSAGTDVDLLLTDLIAEASANVEEVTGLDLLALLSTTVKVKLKGNGAVVRDIEVGALRGLQITRRISTSPEWTDIDLVAPYNVNVGVIQHQVAPTSFSAADKGLSPLFTGTTDEGNAEFTVTESPLVPNLPTLFSVPLGSLGSADVLAIAPVPAPLNEIAGPTLLLGGGPLVNIRGTYQDGSGTHTVGTGTFGPNVDTAPGSPEGYPAWLPYVNQGDSIADQGPIDFLGHAALFLDLPSLCILGACSDLGTFLVGQGVTVFGDSPLPALASLPLLWDTENPIAAQLNELTAGGLLTNPAVLSVVTAALTLAGGGTPDLGTITALLSDFTTFTDLLDAVSGPAGLDAVPGLEDAIADVVGAATLVTGPTSPVGGLLATVLGLIPPL